VRAGSDTAEHDHELDYPVGRRIVRCRVAQGAGADPLDSRDEQPRENRPHATDSDRRRELSRRSGPPIEDESEIGHSLGEKSLVGGSGQKPAKIVLEVAEPVAE
jgi:hypothetical protein